MNFEDIKNICVVGAGNMGHQIALQAAICGYKVKCFDVNQETLKKADAFVDSYLPGRVEKGRLTTEQAQAARGNIQFVDSLESAAGDADFVIEAATEVLSLKRKIFADLDRIAPKHAILATNSSAIVSSKIADATQRQDKVLNMHFFNPALVMKLVEVVKGPHVSDESADLTMELCRVFQKVPVLLKKEVDGFLLNRIFAAISREASWLLEMGVAEVEDIDNACVYGAGHPMGPFRLNDLTGLDLSYIMRMEKFRETGNPADLPNPRLVEHYMKGEYGEKTGKGWYDYSGKK
ncbi:3-hydroxyacyl-CoA dehydrogenase family protein [Pseudohongiella sp. SYSU M77423]|uniref:3-hydroxyacyl-CoA dehydrogenase family protein n=1 Tax=unclassified Pseudohongiella TaxID=2629611 RepID=UPI000C545165|nr:MULTISPECIES: 3-hydroxyacyl-CoA dehydrogenase family protein [unclassified Pseudohongiella]MAY54517.1 3-hydroxyacyl-CoA dehydrogenase [Gammaproteobacteria bacterium]MBJ55376.1 3-hydroxyacyl-CoA dehydrogenase [Gammaproteobacteria bacterium]MDH7943483.1 3-hydroxyacyl-CoA dehydrogenase family protein [Pseudohongiella sp. SYSU M77423]MEC8859579.1 3-hydroxyacyl-CoA dehydrogenase family protein [Pseudomonadota bacterium]|tara:strand:- start:12514 stop:13389 length:876 start_codon:yes stop_codon:yes gene_type:complete